MKKSERRISIYELTNQCNSIRKFKKLDTFRGNNKGDIIDSGFSGSTDGIKLDDFCRSALQQGLEYHVSSVRGGTALQSGVNALEYAKDFPKTVLYSSFLTKK